MVSDPPAVAMLPYQIKPGWLARQVSLDDLIWPLGRPERLNQTGQTLKDMEGTDHLVAIASTQLHYQPWRATRAKLSVMVLEPEAIQAKQLRRLKRTYKHFHRVLTSNAELLNAIPNGVFFPLGGIWVDDWQERAHDKTRMCSLIASGKKDLEGHVLRHDMATWAQKESLDVELMGGGYKPFDKKSDGLSPYRYSIVIENVREPNYFTEKLIDAVLCQSVPIYWGCPNLSDFMETSGIIICETEDELRTAVSRMSEDDYLTRLPKLLKAQAGALAYSDIYQRAARAVQDS